MTLMNKKPVCMVAALLLSCGGSSAQVDSLEPVAAGLHQCSPSPKADTQDGNCTFAADGKITTSVIGTTLITTADGTSYTPDHQDLPAAYKVSNLSVHIEATLMKGDLTPGGDGLAITINTISK
jgi:hypothetical protein